MKKYNKINLVARFYEKNISITLICFSVLSVVMFSYESNAQTYEKRSRYQARSDNYQIQRTRLRNRPAVSRNIQANEVTIKRYTPATTIPQDTTIATKTEISPKTELVIKPFEYYNDPPVQVAPRAEIVQQQPQQQVPQIDYSVQPIKLVEQKPTVPVAPVVPKTVPKPIPVPQVLNSQKTVEPEKIVIEQPITQPVEIKEVHASEPIAEPSKNLSAEPSEDFGANNQPRVSEFTQAPPAVKLTEPQPAPISAETKNILQKLPREIFPKTDSSANNFDVKRTKADDDYFKQMQAETGVGASVAVRRQSLDVNYELEKAYNSLIRGNTETAVGIYRSVLVSEPNNQYALFGLATTYHKLGMLDKARPLYGKLLEHDPYNKEALNNFLALVGEEAPESAILYLEQLKDQNSDFSPIYAQLAQLYMKQNNAPLAIENMQEATFLSPENLVYKYNLAVLYDRAKEREKAMILYRQLLKAGINGQELPASLRNIQERLTFLSSN